MTTKDIATIIILVIIACIIIYNINMFYEYSLIRQMNG